MLLLHIPIFTLLLHDTKCFYTMQELSRHRVLCMAQQVPCKHGYGLQESMVAECDLGAERFQYFW
jgi:hypothetical protein